MCNCQDHSLRHFDGGESDVNSILHINYGWQQPASWSVITNSCCAAKRCSKTPNLYLNSKPDPKDTEDLQNIGVVNNEWIFEGFICKNQYTYMFFLCLNHVFLCPIQRISIKLVNLFKYLSTILRYLYFTWVFPCSAKYFHSTPA